jgi:MFS family permease
MSIGVTRILLSGLQILSAIFARRYGSFTTLRALVGMPTIRSTRPSQARKYSLLVVFCFVQFVDAFSFSSLFAALPHVQEELKMTAGETSWVISAFQLTFASFLLLSGRLSDVTNPSKFVQLFLHAAIKLEPYSEYTFVVATASIGCISIATGFLESKIPFIVFRAIAGISMSHFPSYYMFKSHCHYV